MLCFRITTQERNRPGQMARNRDAGRHHTTPCSQVVNLHSAHKCRQMEVQKTMHRPEILRKKSDKAVTAVL